MGMNKELTADQRGAIIYGYLKKDSYRHIADLINCGKTTVGNVIKKFRETGSVDSRIKRSGRPKLLTSTDRSNLKELVTNGNRRLNLAQVTNLFTIKKKIHVSRSTIRRALHEEDLKSCVARPKPLITPKNIEKRLAWCHTYEHWTVRRFWRVLWSDECTFRLFQGSTCRVWRESHEEWDLECLRSTVSNSPGCMYWGCFSWYGPGPLIPLSSSVTGASYVEILRKYTLPTINEFPGNADRGRPLFQQDNAKPHTAKITKQFFEDNNIRVMDWPPQSPDLSPIENLWHEVKNSVRRKAKPNNLDELNDLIQQAWREIPPELCRYLIISMPNRITACITAEGGPTKY
jgi:transposase